MGRTAPKVPVAPELTKPSPKRTSSASTSRKGDLTKNARLLALRGALVAAGGITVEDAVARFNASRASIYRDIEALRAAGDAVEEERDGRARRYLIRRRPGSDAARFTLGELIALYLALSCMSAFEGTGLDDDVKSVFLKVERVLQRRDHDLAQHLARKFHDVNEAPRIYAERVEDVDDVVTGLLREEELELVHRSVLRGERSFTFRPYTLLVYKKGIYLAGYSSHRGTVVTLPLEGLVSVVRRAGVHFEVPAEYHPKKLLEGRWGLHDGPRTDVRIAFTSKVSSFVERRRWHPSQRIVRRPDGGLDMEITVNGTVELTSWVLSFGKEATLVAPEGLRQQIAEELRAAQAAYG